MDNYDAALESARLLAAKGSPLGAYFYSGLLWQGGKIPEALLWLEWAADKGNADALNRLSMIYRNGEGGVPQDIVKADHYQLRALDAENYET